LWESMLCMSNFSMDLRKEIENNIIEMCQGNPGALTVLAHVANALGARDALVFFKQMKEMNLTGTNVWLAFKDACGGDLGKMIESIRANDPAMVEAVNRWADPSRAARLRP